MRNTVLFHLDVLEFHQFMHYGIDGQSRWGVNLQLAANITPVRRYGVNREE